MGALTRPPAQGLTVTGLPISQIRNGWAEGAVAGALSGAGALPTYWSNDSALTGVVTVGATGMEYGIPYIDLAVSGTPGGSGKFWFEVAEQVDAAQGDVWTTGMWLSLRAGDMTNVDSVYCRLEERASSSSLASHQGSDLVGSLDGQLTRYSFTTTLTEATTDNVTPHLRFNHSSGAWSFTLRIGLPQLLKG